MSATHTPKTPPPNSDDERLDEALEDTFPASDPVQTSPHEKLPPADAPDSDDHDQ